MVQHEKLTDGTRKNNSKEMGKQSYMEDVGEIFEELQIVSNNFGHWGCVSGPVELEFLEISPEHIHNLGECFSCCLLFIMLELCGCCR